MIFLNDEGIDMSNDLGPEIKVGDIITDKDDKTIEVTQLRKSNGELIGTEHPGDVFTKIEDIKSVNGKEI